jgi:hypothetical protein
MRPLPNCVEKRASHGSVLLEGSVPLPTITEPSAETPLALVSLPAVMLTPEALKKPLIEIRPGNEALHQFPHRIARRIITAAAFSHTQGRSGSRLALLV